MLWADALRAVPLVERFEGPVVDVGSGGGSPGIPLAVALPERKVTLLDAESRKCDFLRQWAPSNTAVVWGRAEEQPVESFGVALAKALAQPPVAVEWCLPLVKVGGAAIVWLGVTAELGAVSTAAEKLGGGPPEDHGGLVLIPKLVSTPPGFPRRVGVAKRRPLA
jgi:16S rRNA (guanine527-N7)-methyltransferase